MWTPILYAIANSNKLVDAVKYMIQEIGMHTTLCLKEPLYQSEKDGILPSSTTSKFWNSSLALHLAV